MVYKRVYPEKLKTWIQGLGLVGVPLLFGIFMYLNMMGDITITGYSSDMICAGTLTNPCYAYVNFTANKDIYIYPMSKEDIVWVFNTDKPLKELKLQRSWGTGWRDIDLNSTWSKTVKYAVKFSSGQNYSLRFIGYKNNPYETVKWGFGDIDPYWYGLTTDLVAYYKINEGSGTTTADSSGNGLTGTLTNFGDNTVNWTTGYYGNTLQFDDTEDYVALSNNAKLNISDQITITAWIKPEQKINEGEKFIVSKYNWTYSVGYAFGFNEAGNLTLKLYNGTKNDFISQTSLTENVWSHVVGIYNSTHAIIYLNGNAILTTAKILVITNSSLLARIGMPSDSEDTVYGFNGTIDEVRIYNRALTSAEINMLYQGINVTYPSGTTQYKLNVTSCVGTGCYPTGTYQPDNQTSSTPLYTVGNMNGTTLNISVGFTSKPNDCLYWYLSTNNTLELELKDNLVGYWEFDEGTGTTANDTTSNHNNGVLGNTTAGDIFEPTWIEGKYDSGLSFDGVDNYVKILSVTNLRLINGGTISAWIYPNNDGENHYGRIVDKSINATDGTGGYELDIENTNNIAFNMGSASGSLKTTSNPLTLNSWNHVAVTFDGLNWTIYVNGIKIVNKTTTDLPSILLANVTIGNRVDYSDRTFNGTIDEVRIYNISLTAPQISQLYNRQVDFLINNDVQQFSNQTIITNFANGLNQQLWIFLDTKECKGARIDNVLNFQVE